MDRNRTTGFRRRAVPIFLVVGIVTALVILSLTNLSSASSAPVGVVKTAEPGTIDPGDIVEFIVTFTNSSESAVDVTNVADTLPSGFQFLSMVAVAGCDPLTANPPSGTTGTIEWAGSYSIPAGEDRCLAYSVLVDPELDPSVYKNSLVASLSTGESVTGEAEVTVGSPVLYEYDVYLPMVLVPAGPTPSEGLLAFDSSPWPKPNTNYEIFTVNPDGTGSTNISNEEGGDLDPAWSADGTRIAWVHYGDNGEIYAADADGSNKVNLTNNDKLDRNPDWSPDGSKIAFTSYRDGSWQVYVMNANGSGQTRRTHHYCQSHNPLWSPDGNRIAYICGLDAYAEIYVMSADGSSSKKLTSNGYKDSAPAWSPDSTRLAYVCGELYDAEICVVNVDSGVETQLTDNDNGDYAPDWSPDGGLIAFSAYMDNNYEIATMNASNGSNLTNLTKTAKGDFSPKWSPDGSQISFISARHGNKELYVMYADGSGQLRLTNTSEDESLHDWQP